MRFVWCLLLLVSKLLGFMVSKFLGFNVPHFNDPILPKLHFMSSGKYWPHIQAVRCPSFPTCSKHGFRHFDISQNDIFKNIDLFVRVKWGILVSAKMNHIGFGSNGNVRKCRNHEHDGFSGSPIMKTTNYESKRKQNNYTELSGYSFNSPDFACEWGSYFSSIELHLKSGISCRQLLA